MAKDFSAASDDYIVFVLRVACSSYAGEGSLSRFDPNLTEVERDAMDIATILSARGGIEEMRRIFGLLGDQPGTRQLDMLWKGIGGWGT